MGPFFKISAALHEAIPVHGLCSCVLEAGKITTLSSKLLCLGAVSLQELSSFSAGGLKLLGTLLSAKLSLTKTR